jgi:hypothetical protein
VGTLAFAALCLSGCKRNEEAFVRGVVSSVGSAQLVKDASTLAASTEEPTDGRLPQNVALPKSFRAFSPIYTLRFGALFMLVTKTGFAEHKVGVAVQPIADGHPKGVGSLIFTQIAPGVYYFSQ